MRLDRNEIGNVRRVKTANWVECALKALVGRREMANACKRGNTRHLHLGRFALQ